LISFQYIPNWYIAENNFFTPGINGCCSDFDFIVGELIQQLQQQQQQQLHQQLLNYH
jgi:hypothetical protein